MTTLRNSFEGGTLGVTISQANSGGASGDALTSVADVVGGTCVYGTVTGQPLSAIGMTFTVGGTSGSERRGWVVNAGALTTPQWIRMYIVPSDFVGTVGIARGMDAALATQRWRVQLAASVVTLRDSTNTAIATSPALADARHRIEAMVGGTASSAGRLKIFLGDSQVPLYDSGALAAINFGGDTQRALFGSAAPTTNVSGKIDGIAWSDSAWIGPSHALGGWAPKLNGHVAYLQQLTVDGNTNYVKRRPCVITGFALDGNPILRVGHSGEVYGNAATGIARRTDPATATMGVYVSY
jgi:hypothetical protein